MTARSIRPSPRHVWRAVATIPPLVGLAAIVALVYCTGVLVYVVGRGMKLVQDWAEERRLRIDEWERR